MEYLVRFVQMHETFRRPELEALAILACIEMTIVHYSEDVCSTTTSNTAQSNASYTLLVSVLYCEPSQRTGSSYPYAAGYPKSKYLRAMGQR